jgi:hypothetical protein
MGEEKDFNDTRYMLKDTINANNMRRIMAVCVGMNARSVLCGENKDSTTLCLDDVKTQIQTTQLAVIMKKYYEIGLALELQECITPEETDATIPIYSLFYLFVTMKTSK